MTEHRRFERYSLHLPVTFSKAFTGDPLTQQRETLNLSLGGCLVGRAKPPAKGIYLYLRTYVGEQRAWIKVEVAEVRWIQENTFGVEFIQIQPDQVDQLRQYIGSAQTQRP